MFDFPLDTRMAIANVVKSKKSSSDFGAFTVEDIFSEAFERTLAPYLEPIVEQKIKEQFKEKATDWVKFFSSNITWFLFIPLIVTGIIFVGKYAGEKKKRKE
jgi:hypothetical protein